MTLLEEYKRYFFMMIIRCRNELKRLFRKDKTNGKRLDGVEAVVFKSPAVETGKDSFC